ncbi:flagellin [Paraburkholderia fungorum]|uniref:flagellin N-terminal helical domain-containing protein n=1 Tax=Paraburkholderia fungorum TaxID=134537 RepID=UPI0038BE087C
MTTVINTNIASQIAQNNLLNNQAAVTSAITQLSSGLAINSAADNPAGLAIATTLQAQINGQTVAQQNANNGISLAQTGQSALTQITNNLQTIRQLAVQASNASNTAANRAALNQEVQQSLAQINTIATTTAFNGQSLLDGSFGSQNFQIGANAGQTIAVNLTQGAQTSQIGQTSNTTFSLQGLTGSLATEALGISVGGSAAVTIGATVAGSGAGQSADSAYAAAQAITAANIAGLTASATNTQTATYTAVTNASATTAESFNLTINGTNVFGVSGLSVGASDSVSATTVLNAINSASGTTGVTATLGADGSTFTFNAADGSNISISQGTIGADIAGGLDNHLQSIDNNLLPGTANGSLNALVAAAGGSSSSTGTLNGSVTLSSASSISLSGTGADDIAKQTDNTTNSADSLQTVQTYTGGAFTAATGPDTLTLTGSNLGASFVTVNVNTGDTVTQVAADINNTAGAQAAGISASVNSKGELVLTDAQATAGSSLTIADGGAAGLVSGLAGSTGQNSYVASSSGSLANVDVLTVADSQKTIQVVDAALNQISTLQGQLGAVQNRFTSVISNLSSSVQNAQSTQSSIQDTNYASETSALSRAQVLSQAAQAMVAQANQLPQQVLKLLQ